MLESIIDLFNQVRTAGGWWTPGYAWLLGRVRLFATPWTVAIRLLSTGILQARGLEWLAMPSSRTLGYLDSQKVDRVMCCIKRRSGKVVAASLQLCRFKLKCSGRTLMCFRFSSND